MADSTYQQMLGTAQQGYSDALGGYQRAMAGASTAQPNMIGGLPQFQGNPNFDFSGNPASLGANYAGNYAGAMNYNNQLGQAISGGFGQTMAAQQAAQNRIQGGYAGLMGDVLGGIQGIGQSQANAINRAYTAQSGSAAQGLISRGLGNTTIQDSVQRGLDYDRTNAQTALANQIAGLNAGYQTNIGMAGLNYGNQANMQNTALANQQLGWMNSVNAPYPNAGLYGQLAQQYGASQQQNRMLDALSAARGGASGAQRGLGIGSYVPSGGGFPQRNDYGGGATSSLGGGGPGGYSQLALDQARANQLNQQQQAGPAAQPDQLSYAPGSYGDMWMSQADQAQLNNPQPYGDAFMAATGFPYLGSPAGGGDQSSSGYYDPTGGNFGYGGGGLSDLLDLGGY